MRGNLESGDSVSSDDGSIDDRDHRAIVARRDFLVAVAMTGLASMASCDRHSPSNTGTSDAAAPYADAPADRATPDTASQPLDAHWDYVDGAIDVSGSSEVGGTNIPPGCFCVY
jgi:hypothetical protein